MYNPVSTSVSTDGNTITSVFSRTEDDGIYTKTMVLNTVTPSVSWTSNTSNSLSVLGTISELPDTATEADLKAGNYLVLDGADGTERLPADAVAKAGDVVRKLDSYRDSSSADLSFADDKGNVIAEFAEGHLRTKHFDSKSGRFTDCENSSPLAITDDKGNVIVEFAEGHLRTKYFDSSTLIGYNESLFSGLRYVEQTNEKFIFSSCSLVGSWTKKNIDGTPTASTYSSGSEILVKVRKSLSVTFNFVVGAIAPYVAYNVDDGEFVKVNVLTSSLSINLPNDASWHIVRVRMGTFDLNADAYHTGNGALNFSSVSADVGAELLPIIPSNRKILFIGDSITAGASLNVWQAYSYKLAELLNCVQINSCLPGAGLVHGSRTTLPTARQMFDELFVGVQNDISEPSFCIIMIGTNDHGGTPTPSADFIAEYKKLVNDVIGRFGKILIFACAPFAGYYINETKQAVAGYSNVVPIDTTDLAGHYTTVDGTHPNAAGALVCANFVKEKVKASIPSSYFFNF